MILDRLLSTPAVPAVQVGQGQFPVQSRGQPPAAPCSAPSGEPDLFGDGKSSTCNCRLFWLDSFAVVRCCGCSPPPTMAVVRAIDAIDGDGTAESPYRVVRAWEKGRGWDASGGDMASVDVAGVDAGRGRDVPGVVSGMPIFGPIELPSLEKTEAVFSLMVAKAAGKLDAFRGSSGAGGVAVASGKVPSVPRGKVPFYVVAVGGGGGELGSSGDNLRIVEGDKAAAKYKDRRLVTWAGAGRWWAVAGSGDNGGNGKSGEAK